MKRKDKHINKFLHDPLPDPEVPADDAWASMSDMLATGSVQGANGQSQLSNVWKAIARFKGLLIGTSVIVTSAAVVLMVLNSETKNNKHAENQFINSKTRNSEPENTNLKTNALKPGAEHTDITATSPSETLASKSASEIPTSEPSSSAAPAPAKPAPATASPERSLSKTTSEPGTNLAKGRSRSDVAARNRAISENARIKENGKRAANVHTSDAHTRDARTRAGIYGKEREVFSGTVTKKIGDNHGVLSGRVNQQNNTASPGYRLGSGLAAQQTVPSFSLENNTQTVPSQWPLNSLASRSGHFESMHNDLSKHVKKPALPNAPQRPGKSRNPIWQDIHFGPEWNINRSFVSTDYLVTNADSVKRAARLAIPGVFVSKSWNRHTATFIFNPTHSYFGDKELVAQRLDTLYSSDSSYFVNRHNTRFIKAFGMNFSLQYQYQAFSWSSLVGGVSYAKYSSALLFREIEYWTGSMMMEDHIAAKGQDTLKSYIRPQQWNIRAGILFHSPGILNNRLQVAWMTTIPISNLSLKGFKSVKSPNIQLSVRFLIK